MNLESGLRIRDDTEPRVFGRVAALILRVCTWHCGKLQLWPCCAEETKTPECHYAIRKAAALLRVDVTGKTLVGIILYHNYTSNSAFLAIRKIVYLSEEKKPEM